jgi:hypothetical protein
VSTDVRAGDLEGTLTLRVGVIRPLSKRLPCIDPSPTDTLTDRMNLALNSSGAGFILSLCPATQYNITAPLVFASPNQEISTAGYPMGADRAMLVVSGALVNGTGHTTAVNGACQSCNGVKLKNVQVAIQNECAIDMPH